MTKFSPKQASQIAKENYNITAESSELDGYVDENFLMTCPPKKGKPASGEKFILKISGDLSAKSVEENHEQLDFQIQILKHLSTKKKPISFSEVVPNKEGQLLTSLQNNNAARVLTWVPGRLWATVTKNRKLAKQSGRSRWKFNNDSQRF